MKKTMLALMATVGLAFGAKADDPVENIYEGSTAFETAAFVADETLPGTDEGALETGKGGFWSGDLSGSKVVEESAAYTSLVEYYKSGTHTKYASLETDSAVLLRKAYAEGTGVNFGDIYFDTMVQFTASDGDVDPADGDKLIVWLKADDENNTTNLMITAGALDPVSFKLNGTNDYTVAGTYEAGVWYRLTVKTVWNVSGNSGLEQDGCPGFKVYINGNPVALKEGSPASYDGCFASLVDREASTTLTGIGFKGTGAVDDIAMTREDPIQEVVPTFPMTLTVEGEVNYTDKALYVQDDVLTNEFTSGVAVDVLKETKKITIVVGVFDDYEVIDFTEGDAYVNIDEDPCTYYTKDIAVTSEMLAEGYALTITVKADGGGGEEVPESAEVVADGGKVTVKAANEEAAVEAVTVKGVDGEVYADSQKYYTKSAIPNGDNWDVTVTLDTDTLKDDVDDAVEAALEAVVAGGATTKTVGIPAGFCYKIEFGTTVGLTSEPQTGTSTGSVEMPALGKDAGFFKVSVDTTPFEAGE